MQPYEFGYQLGLVMEKQADPSLPEAQTFGQQAYQGAFGSGNGMASNLDPMQRGMVQDLALYSNPISGVPTAINDTARHLYNGRFLSAGGSALSGALSFLPGFGFAAKAVGRGLASGGKALARAGFQQAGRGLAQNSARFVNQGARTFNRVNKGLSSKIQTVAPLAQNPTTLGGGKIYNAAIKNPLQTGQIAGAVGGGFTGGGPINNMAAADDNFQPGMYGGGQAGMPLASF
jgi:hypothetical protein